MRTLTVSSWPFWLAAWRAVWPANTPLTWSKVTRQILFTSSTKGDGPSVDWSTSYFSLQYRHIVKHMCDENRENRQLGKPVLQARNACRLKDYCWNRTLHLHLPRPWLKVLQLFANLRSQQPWLVPPQHRLGRVSQTTSSGELIIFQLQGNQHFKSSVLWIFSKWNNGSKRSTWSMEKNVSGEYYVMTVFDSQNPTLN